MPHPVGELDAADSSNARTCRLHPDDQLQALGRVLIVCVWRRYGNDVLLGEGLGRVVGRGKAKGSQKEVRLWAARVAPRPDAEYLDRAGHAEDPDLLDHR